MKICTKCKQEKSLSEYWYDKRKEKYVAACRQCTAVAKKHYKETHREQTRAAERKRMQNPEARRKAREAQQRWQQRNPGKAAAAARAWYANNREYARQKDAERRMALKDAVYQAYGGYVCSCCGETIKAFLQIDHINNDGADHRRQLYGENNYRKRGQAHLYRWLQDNGYPPGFQVLCANCNFGKARNGGVCPHKSPEGSETIRKE